MQANSVHFELADFIPYYVEPSQSPSLVYPSISSSLSGPQALYQSLLSKQEFSSLKLTSLSKQKPYKDSPFFNHQEFVARFLSPKTPYNRLLAVHGVGSGKCVHPATLVTLTSPVSIFEEKASISHLWHTLGGKMLIDDPRGGEWCYPNKPIYVLSFNTKTKKLESKRVLRFFREHVRTTLIKYYAKDSTLICTTSHKLYTPKGFQPSVRQDTLVLLNDIEKNTTSSAANPHVKTAHIQFSPLTKTEYMYYSGYVYDLEVEDNHTYVANSFVTHNTCLLTAVGERARQLNPNVKRVYIITKPGLKDNTMYEILEKCTMGKYDLTEEEKEEMTQEAIEKERRKRVNVLFDILTLNEFCSREVGGVVELTSDGTIQANDDELYNRFNNTYIIVDEAHNIIPTKKDKPSTNNYEILKYIIHTIKGIKLLLLTATPMTNDPSEIVPLLNLLLPMSKQIKEKTPSSFTKRWFNSQNKMADEAKFIREYLIGNVSYLRSKVTLRIDYKGDTQPKRNIQYTKIVPLMMDSHQSTVCARELRKESVILDEDTESYGLATTSRQCSNFVFPDGSILSSGEVKWVTYEESETASTSKIKSFRCNQAFRQYLQSKGTDRESMLSQIKKCSVKMEYIIRIILDHPHEKIFVFSEFIRGGGCILLAALLQEFGYEDFPKRTRDVSSMSRAKRFVVFASDTRTSSSVSEDIDRKKKILNHPENRYGDYVQVIIGGGTVSEGVSFFHIRHMFVLSPTWNMAELDQAIGRAVRLDSHDDLPPEQRSIQIYRLCAMIHPNESLQSIDERMYYVSEIKDIKIKQVERLLKVAAIDCSNNKIQNELLSDVINSRECDYGKCRYTCYPEELQSLEFQPISDTYNLFYGESETEVIIELIKEFFSVKFYYDFYELLQKIRGFSNDPRMKTLSSILLARSLYKIIVDGIVIVNRFGFPNYLREDRNLYFLTDDPSGSVFYTLGWYASNPYPDTSIGFDEASSMYYNQHYMKVIRLIEENISQPEVVKTILSNCPSVIAQFLIEEAFTLSSTVTRKEGLLKLLQQLYDKHIVRSGKYLTHKLFSHHRVYNPETKEWSTITMDQFNQLKSMSQQKQEYVVNSDLADKVRIKGYIPVDHSQTDKFEELKIKKMPSIKDDARYDGEHRKGTRCSTGVMYNRARCLELMVELVRLSQQYNLVMPLDNLTKKSPRLTLEDDYTKIIKIGIEKWDLYNQISAHLLQTNQVLPFLFPLKNEMQKKMRKNFCKILSLSETECNQMELSNTTLSSKSNEYSQTQVIDALKEYSEKPSVLKTLFQTLFKRPYSDQLDYAKQMDAQMIEVLSKAVLLTGQELCRGIGRWLEQNELLGIS